MYTPTAHARTIQSRAAARAQACKLQSKQGKESMRHAAETGDQFVIVWVSEADERQPYDVCSLGSRFMLHRKRM